jgi:small subunit ribosomal protein S4
MLLQLLESRLDNVVYRLGFARTRSQARQMVGHGHFLINGRKTTVPSFLVRLGDSVSIRPQSRARKVFEDLPVTLKKYEPPAWISLDKETFTGTVRALPTTELTTEVPVELAQIVEYYSR